MEGLDTALRESGAAAYVAYGSSADAGIRYLTHFNTTDPVVYVKKEGEEGRIVISQMEYERAMVEATAVPVTRAEAGYLDHLKKEVDPWRALAKTIHGLAGGDVVVPPSFPFALGEELRSLCRVTVDRHTLDAMRAVKTSTELRYITHVQRATESAMDLAISLIRSSRPRNGTLCIGDTPLTSEDVKYRIHTHLRWKGCLGIDTIVSCGPDTAVPHIQGTGPLLEGQPIVLDIFPQDEKTGYFSDMTRTVIKGEPDPEIAEMLRAVLEAKAFAASQIRPGASGADVHQSVVDYFRERGYGSEREGFIHNLGHGVGLQVHEHPTLGPGGKTLSAGNVVTIEPGLYYRNVGGVRVEDIGIVTSDGFDLITGYREEPL